MFCDHTIRKVQSSDLNQQINIAAETPWSFSSGSTTRLTPRAMWMRTAWATASPLCCTRLGGSQCRSPQTTAPRSTEKEPGSQVGRPPNASLRYKITESFLFVCYFSSARLKSFVFLQYIPASWTRNSRRLWSMRHSGSTTARRTSQASSRWRGIPLWSKRTMSVWSCGDTERQVGTTLHTLAIQSPRLEKKVFILGFHLACAAVCLS